MELIQNIIFATDALPLVHTTNFQMNITEVLLYRNNKMCLCFSVLHQPIGFDCDKICFKFPVKSFESFNDLGANQNR